MNEITGITKRLVFKIFAFSIAAFLSGCATSPKLGETGKLNHVGLFWLKEPGNAEHRQKLIAAAHSFAREIPEVQFLSVGQTLPKTTNRYVMSVISSIAAFQQRLTDTGSRPNLYALRCKST